MTLNGYLQLDTHNEQTVKISSQKLHPIRCYYYLKHQNRTLLSAHGNRNSQNRLKLRKIIKSEGKEIFT